LFHCFRGHESSCIHSDSPLAIFCDYSGGDYQPFQLADILLDYEPDNVDALRYKYDALKYFLEFSIHEMPSGVLNGYDGASVSDIPAMIEDTNEFERISRKLNMPLCENLVEDCRRYYKAYGDYLQNFDRYGLSDMQTIYKGHPSVARVLSDSHDALLNIGYLVLANYLIIVFLFICLCRKGGKR